MKKMYHSALQNDLDIDKELDFYTSNNNTVIRNDITKGLPDHFNKCDVLYSEPAWKQGYDLFIERAGKEKSEYTTYLKSISKIIENNKKPFWIIIGSHANKYLPKPDRIETIKIHGYKTNLLAWNDNNDYTFNVSNYDFVKQLSNKYNCIGDFSCGYGNSGKIFKDNNKNFVLSDINGKCVYFVAKELMDFEN